MVSPFRLFIGSVEEDPGSRFRTTNAIDMILLEHVNLNVVDESTARAFWIDTVGGVEHVPGRSRIVNDFDTDSKSRLKNGSSRQLHVNFGFTQMHMSWADPDGTILRDIQTFPGFLLLKFLSLDDLEARLKEKNVSYDVRVARHNGTLRDLVLSCVGGSKEGPYARKTLVFRCPYGNEIVAVETKDESNPPRSPSGPSTNCVGICGVLFYVDVDLLKLKKMYETLCGSKSVRRPSDRALQISTLGENDSIDDNANQVLCFYYDPPRSVPWSWPNQDYHICIYIDNFESAARCFENEYFVNPRFTGEANKRSRRFTGGGGRGAAVPHPHVFVRPRVRGWKLRSGRRITRSSPRPNCKKHV